MKKTWKAVQAEWRNAGVEGTADDEFEEGGNVKYEMVWAR